MIRTRSMLGLDVEHQLKHYQKILGKSAVSLDARTGFDEAIVVKSGGKREEAVISTGDSDHSGSIIPKRRRGGLH